jgi:protein involved in polysaccharide export with SLBB domain
MAMSVARLLLAALVATVSWGCGFHGQRADLKDYIPPEEPAALLSDGTAHVEYDALFEYSIGNGDVVNVDVLGHQEFSGIGNVDERGKLAVFNTGRVVEVGGLTMPQVEARIAQAIAPFVVGQPTVRVALMGSKSKYYYMLGGVWHPGVYNMGAKVVRLKDAIAAAGFFAEYRADQSRVGVITPDQAKPTYVIVNGNDLLMGEDKYNIVIKPGDVIFIQNRIIYDLDRFLFTLFRETENASTTNKAVQFWEEAKDGNFGDFSYPRQTITIMY